MKAFPRQINFFNGISEGKWIDDGMDLRDYFAAHSLYLVEQLLCDNECFEDMAEFAYNMADAMMKAREVK